MKPLGSVAAVVAAIQEDAAAAVEAIERDARSAIERIRHQPDDDRAEPVAVGNIAAARERARMRLAQEDWEDTREAIAERERWIKEAAALGRDRIDEPDPIDVTRDRLTCLVHEALARLPAGPIVVVVSDRDAALLGAEWRAAVAPGAAASVRVEIGPVRGGCVVRSGDGRSSFDNSYDARAERLQAQWRAALAALYAEITARALPSAAATEESAENG